MREEVLLRERDTEYTEKIHMKKMNYCMVYNTDSLIMAARMTDWQPIKFYGVPSSSSSETFKYRQTTESHEKPGWKKANNL